MPLSSQQLFDIVRRQIDNMQETHRVLSTVQGPLAPVDQDFLNRIDDWARRILGVVEGHGMEFETYYKHRILKRRVIYPAANGIADVVIGGDNDAFAKAIQSKSTIQKGDGAINNYLALAFGQLAGVGHENPRANDRPTILITIWDPDNTWPYSPGQLNGHVPSLAQFKSKIVQEVGEKINKSVGQQGLQGVMDFNNSNAAPAVNQITTFANSFPILQQGAYRAAKQPQSHDPRLNSTPDYFAANGQKIKTLLVKFKWPVDYACSDAFIQGMNLVGIRLLNGQFQFRIEKEKVLRPRVVTLNDLLNPA